MGKLFSKERRYIGEPSKSRKRSTDNIQVVSKGLDLATNRQSLPCSVRSFSTTHSDAITCIISVSPKLCVTGGKDKKVCVQNIETYQVLHEWEGHSRDVIKVRCSNDLVASCSRDTNICLWRLDEDDQIGKYTGHTLSVSAVDFNNDGSLLCSGSRDNSMKVWDVETEECISSNSISRNLVTDVVWSNQTIVQTSEDKTLKIWDARTLEVVSTSPVQQQILTCCYVSDNLCITGCNGFVGAGCQILSWDVRQNKVIQEYRGHTETVSGCVFLNTRDGSKTFASCSHDSSTMYWKEGCISPITRKEINDGTLTSLCPLGPETVLCSSFNKGVYNIKFDTYER